MTRGYESARIRRRRAAIYRRNKKVAFAKRQAYLGGGYADPYTQGVLNRRREKAERDYMNAWDALRRAELRENRARGPILTGAGILPRRDERAYFDPLALPTGRTSFPRVENDALRAHSHKHRRPSHHVGPCDAGCRMGGRSHEHRGRRFGSGGYV